MPAAFGRLCVETVIAFGNASETAQLPSGGWVLKRSRVRAESRRWRQPPLGGCVLKHRLSRRTAHIWIQPPSGGWVLKHILEIPLRHLPASRLQAAIYQYNSEISYNKGRLKTLSIGFQTTFFSHQHKPDTLE